MSRATLIVNPFASNVSETRLRAVEGELRAAGPLDVILTERPGHAVELVEVACRRSDRIYVFSGDGVYNEALNGLDRDVPIGFLPGGGTSVLPRALGLPRDPVAAARALARPATRQISLGRVNGRRFATTAGIGLDAAVIRRVEARGRKGNGRRAGDVAFGWEALQVLAAERFRLRPRLEVSGLGRAAMAVACNDAVYTYAGARAIRLSPEARFELGLDVLALAEAGPLEALGVVGNAFAGRASRLVRRVHDVDRIEIRCDQALPLQADGEDLGDVEHVLLEAERSVATVLVTRPRT